VAAVAGKKGPVVKVAALVLAGSRGEADLVARAEGVTHKALVDVAGQPMLARVIAALHAAGIARVAVAADDGHVIALAQSLGAEIVASAETPGASVARAFAILGGPLLVTTADHGLLRPEWVWDFLGDAPPDCDVAVLLAQRDTVETALSGSRRTYLSFADGDWSGCNMFLLANSRAAAAIDTWQMVERNRKRPWRIAARLGIPTLLTYLAGRMTLGHAVRRLGDRVGIEAHAVAARDGLAAVDIDWPEDLVDARRIASARCDGARLMPIRSARYHYS